MLVGELDDVQYDLEVDGELVRRQLQRQIFSARGWATVAILYEERASDGTWKPAKVALLRFQHVREAWKKHAALTLSASDAHALGESLQAWTSDLARSDAAD